MGFTFADIVKKSNKKETPLDKQGGTRFDPPRKEVQEINKPKNKRMGVSKQRMGKDKVIKKIEVKENPERKQELEDFKNELGIKDKEMLIKFINDCIDEADNLRHKLNLIRDKAKKHFKL